MPGSIPAALTALADAWAEPAAWTGTTRVGGVDLPREVAGLVVLDEVVVHGWEPQLIALPLFTVTEPWSGFRRRASG